jgi:seryl-tRNA synthetase
MLDIKLIRNEPDKVSAALLKRMEQVDLTEILELDRNSRTVMTTVETERAKRNQLSKAAGKMRATGGDSSQLEAEAGTVGESIASLERELEDYDSRLQNLLAQLPNIPDDRVPPGGKENNQILKVWGEKPNLPSNAKDHVAISRNLGLIDYDRGTKLSGSGFWIYTGLGAALEWSMLNYFCQQHFKDGYTFFLPPHLLTYECGYAAGQFPKFEDDVFHLRAEGNERPRFLLPTAETAILNVYRDETLSADQLPIKCFAYSPCYRREGGSYRTEERGTIRGHQFNKVEMFQFVTPDDSEAAIHELIRKAEKLMEDLGLHYRTSLLAARDTSSSMALTYDIEVWIPSINAYKEVSSVSWARDYQSRRAKIRFKRKGAKQAEYIHTLNGSGLATSRLFPALVEQLQQPDGSVKIPPPLREWMGADVITPPAK